MNEKTLWETYTAEDLQQMEETCRWYMHCLDAGKTERECVRQSIKMAEAAGYMDLKGAIADGGRLEAGDKVYAVYNEKLIILYHIGEESLEKGMGTENS